MRKKPLACLDIYRLHGLEKKNPLFFPYSLINKGNTGIFEIVDKKNNLHLFVLSTIAEGWEHISVSIPKKGKKHKVPTWKEMCIVKDLFFDNEEIVVQFHPKKSEYVNLHKGVLHLWKKVDSDFDHPPVHLVF